MPIYEYRCTQCDNQFEYLVFGSDSDVSCPECDGKKVERLMSCCSFKSSGNFTPASGGSGCTGCSSSSCSTCH